MTVLLYPLLGLSKESSLWLSGFAAFGEYFYHMNMKTPQWIGYFFQRPEAHRIHHLKKKRDHSKNYADLPIWDILGGTFENPKEMTKPTGFPDEAESRVLEMIRGRDVLLSSKKTRQVYQERYSWVSILAILWIFLGLGQSIGYIFNQPSIRGLSFSTVASPLPLVFSVAPNGMETFSNTFHLQVFQNSTLIREETLTPQLYGTLNDKPYNLRNAYGVLFSHGAFFQDEKLVHLRDRVLHYALCHNGPLAKAFDLPNNITHIHIHLHANAQAPNETYQKYWMVPVHC